MRAGSIDVSRGQITGSGTVASSGTLTNDGAISPGFRSQLTLAPAVYQQGTSATMLADGGTLVLAPTTGSGGFANFSSGTLSGGTYEVTQGATLVLPGPVTEITNAAVSLGVFGSSTAPIIETGGAPIEATLGTIGSGARLSLSNYDYVSANTLVVDSGSIELFQSPLTSAPTLSLAGLILSTASSELSGDGTVSSDIANSGLIIAQTFGTGANILDLAGSVSGSGSLEITTKSTLELGQGASGAFTFEGESGVLQLDDPAAFAGTISGFTGALLAPALDDFIDLSGVAPGTFSDVYNGTTAGGVLEVLAPGSIVASLTFVGDYTQDSFKLVPDGNGGTYIELVVPCFAHGTRIATPNGEMAVEDLRVGDRVLTTSGDVRPIVWTGQRRVDCRRHPRTDLVHPVHIRPGAFGENQPKRDLFLSPDHAVFCDGVLIPVHCLINGATILQEQVASVQYFHIELDRHDIVLAEGLATESYLNTGNRAQFENGAAHISLHADFTPRGWDDACAYAPLCTGGPIVEALNRRLWQRAVERGRRSRDPDLRVEVGGRVFQPVAVKGRRLYRFLLPEHTREVCIVARAGVRIAAILVDGGVIGLDSPALAEGIVPLAQSGGERWRATDGKARLLLPEQFGRLGSVLLEVLLSDTRPSRLPLGTPAGLVQAA